MPTEAKTQSPSRQHHKTSKSRVRLRKSSRRLTTAVVVPTLNPGPHFKVWLEALSRQTHKPDRLYLIDSGSKDRTVAEALKAGFEVTLIQPGQFNHGGTRQKAVDRLDCCDLIVFLTQDATLADRNAVAQLIAPFKDRSIAAAYGRQLPADGADPIEAHARLFNYPDRSHVSSKRDILYLGIKASFISNSFAAWRRSALNEIGGFPSDTIQNEDAYAASRLIMAGYKIAYCADARVRHSHRYGYLQEFRRYFDIGVFHASQKWICKSFGQAGSEGLRFVKSELRYLAKHGPLLIPSALIRTALKLIGFKLGRIESIIPMPIKRILSGNKRYWQTRERIR